MIDTIGIDLLKTIHNFVSPWIIQNVSMVTVKLTEPCISRVRETRGCLRASECEHNIQHVRMNNIHMLLKVPVTTSSQKGRVTDLQSIIVNFLGGIRFLHQNSSLT